MSKMQKPFKYTVICNKTGKVVSRANQAPFLYQLQRYEPTDTPNVFELKQVHSVYIDTRYEAKLRLYNYIKYTKKGLPVPRYAPFAGTDISKSIPILNF